MSLFRSEEHVERWLQRNNKSKGAVVDLQTIWRLAKAWYADPRWAGWRPRTPDESRWVITSVGLSGEFWELP